MMVVWHQIVADDLCLTPEIGGQQLHVDNLLCAIPCRNLHLLAHFRLLVLQLAVADDSDDCLLGHNSFLRQSL